MTTQAATIDVEERRTYIGASEAAAAIGLSPWNDPIGLAMEKWGERGPRNASFRMGLGLLVEPVIGTLYRQERPEVALIAGGSRTRRMKGHPWIGAHPDFYVRGAGDLSLSKTPRPLVQAKRSDEFRDDVPLHYRIQGLAELAVTGAPWIDFAVLEGRAFRIFRVEPEPGEIEDLVADLDDYWHTYVVPHVEPPPSSESTSALRERHPYAKLDVGKLASDAQVEKLREFESLKAQEKELKSTIDLLGNEIRAAIGDAKWIEGDGIRATWSRWESDKIVHEHVATAYRKLLDAQREYLIETGNASAIIEDLAGTDDGDPLDTIVGLYTTKEPGHRLTVSRAKEKE